MSTTPESTSTRPYLIRALYEWCSDNGFTPFIAVAVDDSVQVPHEFVKDGEIVLNISFDATNGLRMGNDAIEFKGRFGGVARDIWVPVDRVLAIYARENGQGMAFPMIVQADDAASGARTGAAPKSAGLAPVPAADAKSPPPDEKPTKPTGGAKPALKRIK